MRPKLMKMKVGDIPYEGQLNKDGKVTLREPFHLCQSEADVQWMQEETNTKFNYYWILVRNGELITVYVSDTVSTDGDVYKVM